MQLPIGSEGSDFASYPAIEVMMEENSLSSCPNMDVSC
jgi:hypothetical protein